MSPSSEQGPDDPKYVGPEAMRLGYFRRLATKGPPIPIDQIVRRKRSGDGEEKAEAVDLGVVWDMGAPSPTLLQSEHEAYLLFYLSRRDPNFDGRTVHIRSPADRGVAAVHFKTCKGAHLGPPSEETLEGHPLWGKGVDFYGAFMVRNSRWLAQMEQIDSVHPTYDPKWWDRFNHYILTFHDTTFECVAQGYEVRRLGASLKEAAQEVLQRLTG